ncbi:MAG: hypothetical protein OJF51_000261 [Nitrospira sp.]|nr:MAG: hypothetical protein OJF51_000261 [Nitrospira sp.]
MKQAGNFLHWIRSRFMWGNLPDISKNLLYVDDFYRQTEDLLA